MSSDFSQATRSAKLITALGEDVLALRRFGGEEKMNGLFEFRIEALATDAQINFDDLLGTHATVEIKTIAHDVRYFDGIVTQARWVGPGNNGYQYELVLRPWLWLAGKRRQQRIFHGMSAPDIVMDVLSKYSSLGEVKNNVKNSYDTLEYTVQYGESDLAFALRTMERFGINYHFEFEEQVHKMILTDSVDDLPEIPGSERKYLGNDSRVHGEDEHFWSWKPERNFVTGAIRLTDYNFKTPDAMMEAERMGTAEYAEGQLEGYDFPGDYLDGEKGKSVAALRMNQEEGADRRHRAIGDVVSLSPGMRIKLVGEQHVSDFEDKIYVCLTAQHFYEADSYGSGDGGGQGTSYTGSYSLIDDSAPVVPPRQTPTPVIPGPQTATVVGEGEIDCDEFGRVLVHFPWDLAKANSMRVRSTQSWAHKGWGGIVIPRIGMEVIVEFLNGDPDHPIITGHVYNGKNMPPYELPANKTRSSWKTKTHEGEGFNEIRFEDANANEEILIHAQKDRNEKTLNNHTERVDNNFIQSIGNDKAIEVTNNQVQVVGGGMKLSVGPGFKESVNSSGDLGSWEGIGNVGYDFSDATPAGDAVVEIEANSTTSIGKNETVTVGKDRSDSVTDNSTASVGKNSTLSIGEEYSVNVGKNHSDTAGKTRTITAGDEIILSCGDTTLSLKKNGDAVLSCKNLKVDLKKDMVVGADGKISMEAKKDLITKSSKASMKASGKYMIKGSKVDIN